MHLALPTVSAPPEGHVRRRDVSLTAAAVVALVVAATVGRGSLHALRPLLPVVFTTSVLGALVSGGLLLSLSRIQERPALRWIGVGNLAAAAAMTIQLAGFPGIAPGGGLLGTSADGAAWLYLVWHTAIPLTVVAAVVGVDRRWQWPVVAATATVSLVVAANRHVEVPALFDDALAYVRGLELAMGALTLVTFATVLAWYRSVGRAPLGTEAWVAVSLTLHGFDVATHTVAQERFTALWWASLGSRGGQYVVLAAGLLHHLTRLHQDLHRYARRTEADGRATATAAATDHLTGLLNRRGLEVGYLDVAGRAGATAAVVVIDLDGFKAVNDAHGHDAGDDLLRSVATALVGAVRDGDLVARWGGDEFVVLLPDTTDVLAELVRSRIVDLLAPVASASVGSAHFAPVDPASLEEAMARADAGMYADKRRRQAPTG